MKINIFDTPGYLDFVGEVHQSLRAADSALICVDAKSGVEVGTELAWDYATAAGLPKAFFINKFDDNDARFNKVLDALHEKFGKTVCPLTIPMVKDGVVVGAVVRDKGAVLANGQVVDDECAGRHELVDGLHADDF
mgnify:CR=1 FL=1